MLRLNKYTAHGSDVQPISDVYFGHVTLVYANQKAGCVSRDNGSPRTQVHVINTIESEFGLGHGHGYSTFDGLLYEPWPCELVI